MNFIWKIIATVLAIVALWIWWDTSQIGRYENLGFTEVEEQSSPLLHRSNQYTIFDKKTGTFITVMKSYGLDQNDIRAEMPDIIYWKSNIAKATFETESLTSYGPKR